MQARVLTSTIGSDGLLRLRIERRVLGSPGPGQVLVQMEAAPLNPSDQFLLLGSAKLNSARTCRVGSDRELVVEVGGNWREMFRARLDRPLEVGIEGAGTVIATGEGAELSLGQKVSIFGSGAYATHRLVSTKDCVPLPPDVTLLEASALFVNPLTSLVLLEAARAGGHRGIVQTAAASSLGQMVAKVCQEDGVPLVNIVRNAGQIELLEAIGAANVVNSSAVDFEEQLLWAIGRTKATAAFDAVGGGSLADSIFKAMEAVASRSCDEYSPYGSGIFKQLYIYGGLDPSPTVLSRHYGVSWGITVFFLLNELSRVGEARFGELIGRILKGIQTTFATDYAGLMAFDDLLDSSALLAATLRRTGEKFAVRLNW
ncbi:NADPH2:quinone reductase [Pseudomonas laurylsulfatiphila]|jgi:NADPH:quinone reductase-like Zn-dependent oxidoreductase|uniref:alcohol dehydrogenase catalytic domain-containing protein n=1 Tax=Pseudomonas laurylsulfatiphila TaxID=2011015 RepID=UPI003D1C09FB